LRGGDRGRNWGDLELKKFARRVSMKKQKVATVSDKANYSWRPIGEVQFCLDLKDQEKKKLKDLRERRGKAYLQWVPQDRWVHRNDPVKKEPVTRNLVTPR